MDREPEQRRDLEPAAGPNKMGGELFTITERKHVRGMSGELVFVVRVERGVPFGPQNR